MHVDKDFSGTFDANEQYAFEYDGWLMGDEFQMHLGTIFDDGPWPGNGTASDTMNVRLDIGGYSSDLTINVNNVAPAFRAPPTLRATTDEDDALTLTITAHIYDVGSQDRHRLQITWGDGGTTIGSWDDWENNEIAASRIVASGDPKPDLYPITISLQDDDMVSSDGTILESTVFQIVQQDVAYNNDDDDGNNYEDLLDDAGWDNGIPAEDDLVQVSLASIKPTVANAADGKYLLLYTPNEVRVWSSADKWDFIAPYGGEYTAEMSGDDYLTGIEYAGQDDVWIEGIRINPSTASIQLVWGESDWLNGNGTYGIFDNTNFQFEKVVHGGTLVVTTWGIDVDIDSDNDNGFDYPDNDAWEEYIESHPFSIGKLIETNASHFTPIRLRLPRGLDASDPSLKIEISNTHSNVLFLWNTFKADPDLSSATVGTLDSDGKLGSFIPHGEHSLGDLNYNADTGGITLWAEAITGIFDTMSDVELGNFPDLYVSAKLNGTMLSDAPEDKVKYKPVAPESFYPYYVKHRHLRNAVAADLVYGERGPNGNDTPPVDSDPISSMPYAQRVVTQSELESILEDSGLSDHDKRYIIDVIYYNVPIPPFDTDPKGVPGLRVALFRDYNSGDYTLAYQGTNFDSNADWMVNLAQSLGAPTAHYTAAQVLAFHVNRLNLPGLQLSGQSLGGGLASAGSISSGIHADTFNAAGLNFETLKNADGTEIIEGSLLRWTQKNLLVTSYQVWETPLPNPLLPNEPADSKGNVPDILSYLQRNFTGVLTLPNGDTIHNAPPAIGSVIEIEGLYNWETSMETYAMLGPWYALVAYDMVEGDKNTGLSHLFPSIYYGLLHGSGWNLYDHQISAR
ncbi:hypothetical protein CA51_41850 [Rosistilla oblonga]|uniref:hypothetical protein n=1 Tax=Rosistilla oblonga TaxID=2527990 RepID=UPI00118A6CE2|nr:hypothetical protein [Rosistilla oblonga]QDV14288.1 hypothetical protein CA51_41850 [Rosistilla oblonga]